jgi:hypothetical protein
LGANRSFLQPRASPKAEGAIMIEKTAKIYSLMAQRTWREFGISVQSQGYDLETVKFFSCYFIAPNWRSTVPESQ